jgi:5'-3' exonuclease
MFALIDADIICYRIGFACETENEKITIARCAEFVEDLVMKPWVGDYQGFLTGSNNFRKDIAKTKTYKGNRKQPRPKHYDIIREYLVKAWGCEVIEGQEADDAIGIKAYEFEDKEDFVIMSIDKDLDMIEGWHYNFVKDNKYFVEQFDAITNFYRQILTGDKVDNIPGLKGIGPEKADKILKDCSTEEELFEAVLKAYDGNIDYLTEMGQLLWIRRKPNEIWQPPLK